MPTPATRLVPGLIIASVLIPFSLLQAETFDLNYSLIDASSSATLMELTPAEPYRGVELVVTSDIGTQYEVIQSLVRPLENRDNPSLTLERNLVVRSLSATSQKGNLRLPSTDEFVTLSRILYTSTPIGDADRFTLVFGIRDLQSITPGYYQGQIGFTLRPIGSGRQEVTKYLSLRVVVEQGASGNLQPRVEITSATGSGSIELNPRREESQVAELLVKINGTFKKQVSLIQYVPQPPESQEGQRLSYEAVEVSVAEARKGMGVTPVALSNRPQILYTSLPNGETDESFLLRYRLSDLSAQKAGRYACRLQYFLDELGTQTKLDTFDLEIENERIFELLLTPQDQKDKIEFAGLKPKDPPKRSEVIIQVRSNIGKPYQVSQKVLVDLTSKDGQVIPQGYFTVRTEGPQLKGTARFPQNTAVKKGESVLFVSDAQGSADTFAVVYELTCPPDVLAGDYATRITYSLLEM